MRIKDVPIVMKRILLSLIVLSPLLIAADRAGADTVLPRVMVLHLAGSAPYLDKVLPLLNDQLSETGFEIEVAGLEVAELPTSDTDWFALARKTASDARTVAVAAYDCNEDLCTITMVQLRAVAKASLSYPCPKDPDALSIATASTLREILMGPLFSELRRLADEARAPSPPKKTEVILLQSPFESSRQESAQKTPPWLWLEGAYQGDFSHPAGRPIHGVSLGIDFEPASMLGVALHVGWLGARNIALDGAEVRLNRMTGSLAIRLIFSLGPARIALSGIGRLDVVFSNTDNAGEFKDTKDTYLEVNVGGMTAWLLPLSRKLSFIIGAGLLASVVSQELEVVGFSGNRETAIPASTLRMIWTAGLAFCPLGTPSGK